MEHDYMPPPERTAASVVEESANLRQSFLPVATYQKTVAAMQQENGSQMVLCRVVYLAPPEPTHTPCFPIFVMSMLLLFESFPSWVDRVDEHAQLISLYELYEHQLFTSYVPCPDAVLARLLANLHDNAKVQEMGISDVNLARERLDRIRMLGDLRAINFMMRIESLSPEERHLAYLEYAKRV